jgi:hypothetical protein
MAIIYSRIHGPEHNNARRAKALLEKCKKRYVVVELNGALARFQVDLQLYDNVETLVIIGPITNPRIIANERTVQLRQDQVPTPCKGCPVICHGLVKQPHLNCGLGDVATYRHVGSEFQIQVLFEKRNLKLVWVCPEHLQIVFELPRRAMGRLNPNNLPWIMEDFISRQRILIEHDGNSDLPYRLKFKSICFVLGYILITYFINISSASNHKLLHRKELNSLRYHQTQLY